MKVLMFGWEFPPHNQGGLGTACEGLVEELLSEGVDVTLVLPFQQETNFPHLRVLSPVKAVRVKTLLKSYMDEKSYEALLKSLNPRERRLYGESLHEEVERFACMVAAIVEGEHFDIIHAHDWLTYKAGLAAKHFLKIPLVVHMHATEFDRGGRIGIDQRTYDIERTGLHLADHIIAVSQFTKNTILEHYGIADEKVTVIHNGVAQKDVNPQVCQDTINERKSQRDQIVLFLGRLTIQKGPEFFIEAAKKVAHVRPRAHFVIAGSGDMQLQLLNAITDAGLAHRFTFTGFLRGKHINEMYKRASVFVMPSVSEPFGIVPLEAMRNDVPTIVSKQSGVSELVNNVFKVDFWDVSKMASTIIGILDHEVLHDEIIHNAKKEVITYTWKRPARSCVEVYNKVLGEQQ